MRETFVDTDNNSAKAIFIEYFRSWELLHYVRNFLPLPFLAISGKKLSRDVKPEPLIESVSDKAKDLKLDQSRFKRLLKTHISVLIAGRQPTKSLGNLIRSHCKSVKDEISNIPNTLDKARDSLLALIEVEGFADTDQVYDAMVLLSDKVSSELTAKVMSNWKREAREHEEEHTGAPYLVTDIFWVSRDFMETIDGVSRYRFREHFGIGEFEPAFAGVAAMLATSLLEGSTGTEAMFMSFWGDAKLTSVAYDLWLVSRSRELANRIRNFVDAASLRIAGWQYPEGWWTDFELTEPIGRDSGNGSETPRRFLHSTYLTALCSLNLLKLSVSESRRQKGVLGAKWLLERQNPDGSWSRERISKDGITLESDILTSLLALEALVRSGIENIEHSIKQGIEWIMQQQDELGMWDDEGFPFPFMTVLILELMEFIKSRGASSSGLDPYLSMSRAFLDRSVQLSLEENSNSHRLAIIAAFHGIEAFLYSVLDHPSVNIKIFQKADETIGMRKALTRFQEYLQSKGKIKQNEVVPYRNSLDKLAYLRDQVVHKAINITQSECRPLVDNALKFAAKYSLEIFGFDVFA
jgi:hypothetical protein